MYRKKKRTQDTEKSTILELALNKKKHKLCEMRQIILCKFSYLGWDESNILAKIKSEM